MCGMDIVSLEDSTKQHYIYPFDPEYVKRIRVPNFDPHMAMALFAKFITQEDEDFYKWYGTREEGYIFTAEEKKRYKALKEIRYKAKTTNFSAIYGVRS